MILKALNQLSHYDPSKYTVYQMIEYAFSQRSGSLQAQNDKKKLVQQEDDHLSLFKTEPFQNVLYNYVYVLEEHLTENDLCVVRAFFGDDAFRITIPKNEEMEAFLIQQGYLWKSNDAIMVWENEKTGSELSFSLPEGVEIRPVKDLVALQDYKMIFAEAFRKTLEETEEKFGFCDEILLNAEDSHLNAFVLYENGTPATAGAYYAFDYFSVENIGTRPPFSGKGYAASIVKKLLQEAGKLGYQQACLVASEEGSRVYEKIGFTTLRETVTFVAPL